MLFEDDNGDDSARSAVGSKSANSFCIVRIIVQGGGCRWYAFTVSYQSYKGLPCLLVELSDFVSYPSLSFSFLDFVVDVVLLFFVVKVDGEEKNFRGSKQMLAEKVETITE